MIKPTDLANFNYRRYRLLQGRQVKNYQQAWQVGLTNAQHQLKFWRWQILTGLNLSSFIWLIINASLDARKWDRWWLSSLATLIVISLITGSAAALKNDVWHRRINYHFWPQIYNFMLTITYLIQGILIYYYHIKYSLPIYEVGLATTLFAQIALIINHYSHSQLPKRG